MNAVKMQKGKQTKAAEIQEKNKRRMLKYKRESWNERHRGRD